MPKRYIPPSIEQRGLRNYLEATRSEHKDQGYDAFITFADVATRTKLAELFGVDPDTIRRWIKVYNKEKVNASSATH